MSLINCPECKKEISSSCNECPYCGYILKTIKKKNTLLNSGCIVNIISSTILIFFILFLVIFNIQPEPEYEKSKHKSDFTVEVSVESKELNNHSQKVFLIFLILFLIASIGIFAVSITLLLINKYRILLSLINLILSIFTYPMIIYFFNNCCFILLVLIPFLYTIGSIFCIIGGYIERKDIKNLA